MALTKITKNAITDDAVETAAVKDSAITAAKIAAIPNDSVDATKIADDAISEEHIDNTAITGHTQLSANAASLMQVIQLLKKLTLEMLVYKYQQ